VGSEVARELVKAFTEAKYTGEDRHQRRLNKVLEMEKDFK
jgi:ribose 5-phosphate isomerase B